MPGKTSRPLLSVVVGVHNGAGVIRLCLSALDRQSGGHTLEVIVADSSSDGTADIVRKEFPQVRLLHTDHAIGVPQLRGLGIAEAAGDIIAILDPFSVAEPGWAAAVIQAHETHANLVIGGSVNLYQEDSRSLAGWAIYFHEYGMFMPPVVACDVAIVPGCNVSYKRTGLFDGAQPRFSVFWKTFVNEATLSAGAPLRLEPSIRVSLNKPVHFGEFFGTRSRHGRCYAARRVGRSAWPLRMARAATTPLLPLLLCARWTRVFWPKRRRRGTYLLTLPLQLALFGAWAWGELLGYLMGPAESCNQLYY